MPQDFLSSDETLYPTRVGVALRQYNKNKPAKYGLLFQSINTARFPHTDTTIAYSRKPMNPGPYYLASKKEYSKLCFITWTKFTFCKGETSPLTDFIYRWNWQSGYGKKYYFGWCLANHEKRCGESQFPFRLGATQLKNTMGGNKAILYCNSISCEAQINEQAKCDGFINHAANPRSDQRRREEKDGNIQT